MIVTENRLKKIIREELEQYIENTIDESDFSNTLKDIAVGAKNYIRMGSSGSAVTALQSFLLDHNYDLGDFGNLDDGIDGKFGQATHDAIFAYQSRKNYIRKSDGMESIYTDGIVGPQTAKEILIDLGYDISSLLPEIGPDSQTEPPSENDEYYSIPDGSTGCPPHQSGNEYGTPGGGSFTYQLQQFDSSNNNWRSSQPTAAQLEWLINTHSIDTVIRLNGNEGKLTLGEEKLICDRLDVTFNEGTSSFIDSHSGYQKGKGYVGTISTVLPILARGNCLIHCRAGADRTGYLVAAYLKARGCSDIETLWDYTISFNSWSGETGPICRPDLHPDRNGSPNRGYIKYLEGFYPMKHWCRARSWRKDCVGCSDR